MEQSVLCKAIPINGLSPANPSPVRLSAARSAGALVKTLFIMRITLVLLLATALHVSASTSAQNVTISARHISLERSLLLIQKQTGYSFFCDDEVLEKAKSLNLSIKDAPLTSALKQLLSGLSLAYNVNEADKVVFISYLPATKLNSFAASAAQVPPVVHVHGHVTDKDGQPLQGVSIHAKGTTGGTVTDNNGDFTLTAPQEAILEISIVGYESQEIALKGRTELTVQLNTSNKEQDQVVVVGYGTARKRDLTGAVSSITSKDFNTGAITDPMQQIEGKVPGLSITQPSGDPNQTLIIRLRGQASLTGSQTPLIVLDGVPLSDPSQISNIQPADIASYDVLKDASAAAIYGSRGANGVIIINTKKAQSGQLRVEYNTFVTIDKVAKYYPVLNLNEWRTGSLNYLQSTGASLDSAENTIGEYGNGNTDWQRAITRTAFSQNHNLSVSGGTGHLTLRGSLSYIDQQGVVLNSAKKGLGLNLNVEEKAMNDKLDIQLGINNTQYNRNMTDPGQFSYTLYNPPSYPVYNPNGTYYTFNNYVETNPVEHLNEELDQWRENFTVVKALIDYSVLPGLKVGTLGSMSHFNQQRTSFIPTYPSENNLNSAGDGNYNTDVNQINFHIQYNHDWGRNNLGLSGIYEYSYFSDDHFTASGEQFPVPQNQSYNLGSGNQVYDVISSTKEESILESYMARATYNYNSEYYATATFRRDGSSKFGSNNRFGNFPSFDVAWAISQESFMKQARWVNFLKVRAGYGVTGNQDAISDYNTQFLLGSGSRYFDATSSAFPYPTAYSPSQNANPDLKWETRHGKNIGLDFSLFNNRLSGDVDYFNDKTTNLLDEYTVPTPPFYLNTILANIGTLTNKGLEVGLTYNVIRGKHFGWTASGQISFVNTRIVNLNGGYDGYKLAQDSIGQGSPDGRGLNSTPITYYKAGFTPYEFYLPHFVGLTPGGAQLFDSAGKGVPVGNAKSRWINPAPKFNYGFGSTFSYDNWSLNFFLHGVMGQKIFNNTALNNSFIKNLPGDNVFKDALTNGITDGQTVSDHWLQKAGYLRLQNLTVAYTFRHLKGIDDLKIYAAGNNLFVITKYQGLDPEISNTATTENGGTFNNAYIDVTHEGTGYYYKTRSYSLGVNIGLK